MTDTPAFSRNIAQHGDALTLLRSLPDSCSPLIFFDPQYREGLDRLAYGNEGKSRQKARAMLPKMSTEYIDCCCREAVRVLRPSGYLLEWTDNYRFGEGYHLRVADVLKLTSFCAWDSLRPGQGYRFRNRGDYLLALQKPPLRAKATWRDHGIDDRWPEQVDHSLHPHAKPIGLISRLINCLTVSGDLIVDPAAGSFTVMYAALDLRREFIGVDLAYEPERRAQYAHQTDWIRAASLDGGAHG